MNLFSKGSAAMAEWSNAPVWKAGLLTEARVRISFAASLLFSFEKRKKCATSQKRKPGVFYEIPLIPRAYLMPVLYLVRCVLVLSGSACIKYSNSISHSCQKIHRAFSAKLSREKYLATKYMRMKNISHSWTFLLFPPDTL